MGLEVGVKETTLQTFNQQPIVKNEGQGFLINE